MAASAAYGETTINPDGSITYTPDADYHGYAWLYYEIRDTYGNRALGYGEVLVRSVNDAPVADDDIAFTGKDAWIEVYSLIGDTDPDNVFEPNSNPQIVADATQPTYGTVWFSAGSVFYEPEPGFVSGTDSFQYTMVDGHGGSSSAQVNPTMVEVTGYTLEWLNPDDNWEVVPPGEVSWSHDTLRWTPHFTPFDPPEAYLVEWKAIAWPNRNQPVDQWSTFASGDPFVPTEGNPGANDWAITPLVHFYYYDQQAQQMSQTGFAVPTAAPPEKIIAEITDIQWVPHTVAGAAAQLVEDGWNLRVYPDAPAPGGSARTMVDVVATVSPHKAGIPFFMDWFDVDDWTDDDGPVDTDPTDTDVNNWDNRLTPGFSNTHFVTLDSPVSTDANGQVRATLDIGPIQPGNNFRVAAAGRCEEIARVKALARDPLSGLFYDKDEDGRLNIQQGDVRVQESGLGVAPARASRLLTVWRRLHMEVDSMGAVSDNTLVETSGEVVDQGDGTILVPLPTAFLEPHLYHNGWLQDDEGLYFQIIDNSAVSVTVRKPPWGDLPASNRTVWIRDDDVLVDGQDVPMPDTSALPRAMFDAFVEVVFDLPGETDVDFVLNVMSREEVKGIVAQRWNSAPLNSTPFWVGYLLGGYQYQTVMDNDPDYGVDPQEQLPEWGVSSLDGKGGAVVWLETTWDRSRQLSQEGFGEQDTVVHEVGHLFGGGEPVTLIDQDAPCVYTEQYLAKIRSAAKPEGP